jgi:hypothetical protein
MNCLAAMSAAPLDSATGASATSASIKAAAFGTVSATTSGNLDVSRDDANGLESRKDWSILFLGTGVSTALPKLLHIVTEPIECETCIRGLRTLRPDVHGNLMTASAEYPPHPDDSKNVRGNVQLCLRLPHPDGRRRVIVIDCGKTSRSAMNTFFAQHGISYVDAVRESVVLLGSCLFTICNCGYDVWIRYIGLGSERYCLF